MLCNSHLKLVYYFVCKDRLISCGLVASLWRRCFLHLTLLATLAIASAVVTTRIADCRWAKLLEMIDCPRQSAAVYEQL